MSLLVYNTQPKGYRTSKERKATGAHYTPVEMADFLAREMVEWLEKTKFPKKQRLNILDPTIGDGVLLESLIKELQGRKYTSVETTGFDIDEYALDVAWNKLGAKAILKHEDFLNHVLENYLNSRSLFSEGKTRKLYHLVITNPPYIRTQVLGSSKARRLSDAFGLSGRVDIYHAFFEAISAVMAQGGIAGLIVSNRFMTTQAGSKARSILKKEFDILHVWDLGDTKLFEAAVLPALLLLRKKSELNDTPGSKMTTIYSVNSVHVQSDPVENIFSVLNNNGVITTDNGSYMIQNGRLNSGATSWDIWRLSNKSTDNWLKKVSERTHCLFSHLGKIRVGIKTTADKVFIRDDWESFGDEKPELLRPLITHHVADHFKAQSLDKQVLYPHESLNGKKKAIKIANYPKSSQYLERHRDVLEGRTYVRDAGRKWYEIWVPQDPEEWKQSKIVFRDISKRPFCWLDESGAVVNGDCYWISCKAVNRDLIYLALAVANSKFITLFYDRKFNNKLYAERRRFITQYVKDFPIPNPQNPHSKEIVALVGRFMETEDQHARVRTQEKIDTLVWHAFDLPIEKISW